MVTFISEDGLRDIIERPAQLANLDVSEDTDAIILGVPERIGALPLVENAFDDLWSNGRQATKESGSLLSGMYLSGRGGPAGLLASKANDLLGSLEADYPGKGRRATLELLLSLVNINPGGNHTRRRTPYDQAVLNAGDGDDGLGKGVVQSLAGARLITISSDAGGQFVDLIHETLIRTRIDPATGKMGAYWPTLHDYIEANRDRDQVRQQLAIEARRWQDSRWFGRWWNLAVLGDYLRYRSLRVRPLSQEGRFLKWSFTALVCSNTIQAQFSQGGSAYDYTELRFVLQVPPDVVSFSYDFAFFSTEYPWYYSSGFNDMYVGWLDSEKWTGNISFDANGNPISLNAGFLEFKDDGGGNPVLAGTCMRQHAGTNWLQTTAGVTPGEQITVVFAIFDLADPILDSYISSTTSSGAASPAATNP